MKKNPLEKKLEKFIIEEFKDWWKEVSWSLKKGDKSVIEDTYWRFEAVTDAKQKYLAKRFYGEKHANKMAHLSKKDIHNNLEFCIDGAVKYIQKEFEDFRSRKEAAKDLILGEYILCESRLAFGMMIGGADR